jgi:hypothetical protein
MAAQPLWTIVAKFLISSVFCLTFRESLAKLTWFKRLYFGMAE